VNSQRITRPPRRRACARTRLRLIIIDSGIPQRTPRAPWLCSDSLSFRTGLPGAAALSGGRHSARPYFGRDTSVRRRLVGDRDPLGCFSEQEWQTRSLYPRTTAVSSRHRKPDPPWAASGRFQGRPRDRGTDTSFIRSVKKADSWRCPSDSTAPSGRPCRSVSRWILAENPSRL